MDQYSFLENVTIHLGKFLERQGFSLNRSSSKIFPGFQNNLLKFESQQCQMKIYVEHYRVEVEISALSLNNPNLWYGVDIMACFISKTSPSLWEYNLPRGIPLSQVIEQQLKRWKTILNDYFERIVPLFESKDKLYSMQKTLDEFVRDFYKINY